MKPRSVAWIVAVSLPLWFIPLWIGCWKLAGLNLVGITTATGGLLLVISLAAAHTDLESARIPNWITYSGTVWAFLLNSIHTWLADESTNQSLGTLGIGESLIGFATLFFGLLVIFSFSGGGAGDVKLAGAIGAFLGLQNGFEAILLAFICCAVVSLIQALFRRFDRTPITPMEEMESVGLAARLQTNALDATTALMKQKIRLGPFFAIGTILVLCRESGMLKFSLLGY